MKYQGFLTRKYLFSRFIPFAAVIAVAVGVFALITVLSVMEGFKVEMRKHLRGFLSHLMISGDTYAPLYEEDFLIEEVSKLEHVTAVAPYLEATGLFKSLKKIEQCMIRGVDPAAQAGVGEFARYLLRDREIVELLMAPSSAEGLPESRPPLTQEEIEHIFSREKRQRVARAVGMTGFDLQTPPQPIVVGIEAIRSGTVDLGHVIDITSFSPVTQKPRGQEFMVVGAFQSGNYDRDRGFMFMPLRAAQSFLECYDEQEQENRFTGLAIHLDDYTNADKVRESIHSQVFPKARNRYMGVRTWEDLRQNLLQAVEIEKSIVGFLMMFIVAFAGIVIFLILMLLVIEKTRDLGVLRSLGARASGVVGIFLRFGLVLVTTGIVLGGTSAYYFGSNINTIHDWIKEVTGLCLFPPSVYYFTKIPVAFRFSDIFVVLAVAGIFGFLGSLIPAIWAARQDPIKALQHD